MSQLYRFDVKGDPKPQGSKRAFVNQHTHKPSVTEMAGAPLKAWRAAVDHAARAAIAGRAPLDEPLFVSIDFRFAMPKSRPAAVRAAGAAWKATTPDLDKVIRSTLDALGTAGAFRDDCLVVALYARQLEVYEQWTGATIAVHRLPGVPLP